MMMMIIDDLYQGQTFMLRLYQQQQNRRHINQSLGAFARRGDVHEFVLGCKETLAAAAADASVFQVYPGNHDQTLFKPFPTGYKMYVLTASSAAASYQHVTHTSDHDLYLYFSLDDGPPPPQERRIFVVYALSAKLAEQAVAAAE